MKIICDNQKEYDDLMEACKYLHDFNFYGKDKRTLWRKIKKTGGCIDQGIGDGMTGLLLHLYLGENDFPNKKDMLWIEGGELK